MVLADVPSFGAGFEMAWAAGARCEIVVLAHVDTVISKLVVASTGNVSVLQYESDSDLRRVLAAWIADNWAKFERHRDTRLRRETLYGNEWAKLRREVQDVGVSEAAAMSASLSITRIQEIIKSPSHFGNATRDELAGVQAYIAAAKQASAAPSQGRYDEVLDHRQLVALEDAAEIYEWTPMTVESLKDVGRQLLQTAGVHRITLSSPADWKQLWDARRDV